MLTPKNPIHFSGGSSQVESKIKSGERHIQYWTTRLVRSYAEDVAKYFRELGYDAEIKDVYNLRTGERGGNYLKIDL